MDGSSYICWLIWSSNHKSSRLFQGLYFLPSATKLRQGNVFTPVSHSVHRGGVCVCMYVWQTPPPPVYPSMHWGRHSPMYPSMHWGRHPPVYPSMHWGRHPPHSDGHCSGWHASYWNAILFSLIGTFSK